MLSTYAQSNLPQKKRNPLRHRQPKVCSINANASCTNDDAMYMFQMPFLLLNQQRQSIEGTAQKLSEHFVETCLVYIKYIVTSAFKMTHATELHCI